MIRLYQNILGAFLFLFVSDFFPPQHIASFFLPIRAKTPSHHCCNYLTHNYGYSSDCCNYFVICYLGCSATSTDLFVLSISALVIYHTSFLDTRLLVFALFNMQWDLDGKFRLLVSFHQFIFDGNFYFHFSSLVWTAN